MIEPGKNGAPDYREGRYSLKRWSAFTGIIVILLAAVCCLVIGRKVLFAPGVVILAENLEVGSIESLRENYRPYWQSKFQYFDFGITDSIYIYGLAIAAAKALGLSYETLQRLLLILPHGIAFIAMWAFVRYLMEDLGDRSGMVSRFCLYLTCALIYTFNPWIAVQPRDIALRFDYSLTPLLLLLMMKAFDRRKGLDRSVLSFGMILTLVACFRYVLLTGLVLVLYALIPYRKIDERGLKYRTRKLVLILFCFSALSMGKFLAPVRYALEADSIPYAETFREDMIGEASIPDILSTKVMNSPARQRMDDTYSDDHAAYFSFISIVSFLYLIMVTRPLTKHEIFFPILVLATMPLSMLGHETFREMNYWILTKAPFSSLYGRLLRYSDWNSLAFLLSICVMFGYTIRAVSDRFARGKKALFILLVPAGTAVYCGLCARPLLTGDMNGYWNPSIIPREFSRINDQLRLDSDDFHVLWLPTYWENKAEWAKNQGQYDTTAPTCNFGIRSSAKPSYLTESFYFFDYYNLMKKRPGFRPLEGYRGGRIGDIYKDVNIRYAAVHTDVNWTRRNITEGFDNNATKETIDALKANPSIESVEEDGVFTLIRFDSRTEEFACRTPVSVLGGLPVHGCLADLEVERRYLAPIYFDSAHFRWDDLQRSIEASSIVLTKGISDPVLAAVAGSVDRRDVHAPYEQTMHHVFTREWSRAQIQAGIGNPRFQEALYGLGIDHWAWDFDYGKGVAFTLAPNAELEMPIRISKPGAYIVVIRSFTNQRGGGIHISLGNRIATFLTESSRNHFEWKELLYVNLAKGKHELVLKNIFGFNAVNQIAIVSACDWEARKETVRGLMDDKICVSVYEGETDFEKEGEGASVEKQLSASNGRVMRLSQDTLLKCTLPILKEGEYILQFRFQGKLVATIDEEEIHLCSQALEMVSSPPLHLEIGEHEMTIEPLESSLDLDVLWMGPAASGDGVHDWLDSNDDMRGEILKIDKRSEIEIRLKVRAGEPFILSMAEGYDPMIVACSERKQYESLPVFGLVNGFLIDEPGDLDLRIRFLPQEWTRTGTRISLFFALLFLLYLPFRRSAEFLRSRFQGRFPE